MKGDKYLLKGQINVGSRSFDDGVSGLPENFIVDILNSGGKFLGSATSTLTSSGNDQSSAVLYEYSLWANLGEELVFVPRDPRYSYFSR